jgi:hypothetical protein
MPGHYDKGLQTATQRAIPLIAAADGSSTGRAVVQGNLQAAKMNGRLYRQCRNYDVSFSVNLTEVSHTPTLTYDFFTLPDTWFVRGAIRHAYNTYMQMMQDELAQGVKMARWHDFSINEQNPDGVYEYLSAAMWDGDGWGTLAADETITDSSVTDSSGTSQGFHLIGNVTNSFNIFREYSQLLNYNKPTDESVSSTQPYDGLLDLDDADVLSERGDRAPYDRDWSSMIPDDATVDDSTGQHLLVLQDSLIVDANAGPVKTKTRTFTAPLGLVWIRKESDGSATDLSSSTPDLSMHFAKGSYKGVKAPSLV